ncbi:serine/threonine-protein kinase [Fontisphaera persica]|uniref:serine/threonine protein kinase n=1 Tax=Fontisphaera persica TaxID=2974023 RepID=UPI0024BFC289|nr:serine/threonine-protein kinase [Fontisphaera persica]WCJ59931.1 serine/threonine-protein kinase [Fontisphaera persica]
MKRGGLAGELAGGKPATVKRILEVLIPVAEALTYAHARGLIHRDLKPDNILLAEQGKVYLSDFGLARTLFNERTLDVEGSHCEGTAPYLSPAVAHGQAEDTRCDIYSLGAILYQMLTGRLPYSGRTTEEVIAQIKAGPPRPILELNPKAPAELVLVCETAMARDQRDRYANMADFLEDLRRIQRGQLPVGAHAGTAWVNRARVSWRRHWPKIVTGACLSLAALGLWHTGWLRSPVLKPIQVIQLGEGFDHYSSVMGNWDLDKVTDFLVLNRQDNSIQVVDATNNRVQLIPCPKLLGSEERGDIGYLTMTSFSTDKADDLIITYSQKTQARAKVINPNLLTVAEFTYEGEFVPANRERAASATVFISGMAVDLDNDQKKEFLFHYGTPYGQRRPRGLVLMDMDDTKGVMRWDFPTAPYIRKFLVQDLEGDGKQEIIFGTHATCNGKQLEDGTDDFHSHLAVLNANGELRWRRTVGKEYTAVVPLMWEAGSSAPGRIYAWLSASYLARHSLPPEERGPGIASRIFYVEANGEGLREYLPPFELVDVHPADVTGDGRRELVMTDTNGWVRVLSQDLQVIRQTRLAQPRQMLAYAHVLGNVRLPQLDGGPYVAVLWKDLHSNSVGVVGKTHREFSNDNIMHEVTAMVLDRRLQPVFRAVLHPTLKERLSNIRGEVKDVDGDGAEEIVVFSERITICKVVKE